MLRKLSFVCVVTLSIVTQGCGGDSLDRRDLSGKVTYKDQPVPYGTVSFRPNRSKGGSGPTGFAKIEDGEFSTAGVGKAAMTGPIQVYIEGAVSKEPYAAALFPIYKTDIEVTGDKTEFDFSVPETAPQSGRKRRR